jgi:hypothetical protein
MTDEVAYAIDAASLLHSFKHRFNPAPTLNSSYLTSYMDRIHSRIVLHGMSVLASNTKHLLTHSPSESERDGLVRRLE